MASINLSVLLREAHSITAAAVAEARRAGLRASYSATFGLSLREAWQLARLRALDEEETRSASEVWRSMSGEEQYNALRAMTFFQYGRREARMTPDGKPMPNLFLFVRSADDLQGVVSEAWIDISERIADGRAEGIALGLLLARSVLAAAARIDRAERRNASAASYDAAGNLLVDLEASVMAARARNPEDALLAREALRELCADSLDRDIFLRAASGWRQAEIASDLGINQATVSRRLAAMDARL